MQGIEHILFGTDHLLFVLGLMLMVRDRWMLLKTITAFTVAHSITLAAATLGYVHVPAPPLERRNCAFDHVRRRRGTALLAGRDEPHAAPAMARRLRVRTWCMGSDLPAGLSASACRRATFRVALLLFNIGVEVGQLSFVALILLLLRSFDQLDIHWPQPVRMMPAYVVGSLGAFWTIDRIVAMIAGTG